MAACLSIAPCAANSLRQPVEHEVLLSVPSIEILSQEAATQIVAKPDNPNFVAVRQDFSGAFSGRALLIFPEANSLELVRAVVSRQLSLEDIVDLEDEALAETGKPPTATDRLALAPISRSVRRIAPINPIAAPRAGCAKRTRHSGLRPRRLRQMRVRSYCSTSSTRRNATLISAPASMTRSILPTAPTSPTAAARAGSAPSSAFSSGDRS